MAEKEQIKQTAVIVLGCLEKVSSFASSFNPLFGIVTTLVGVVRKGLEDDEVNELDKDFQQIHDKLKRMSEQNKELLDQIQIMEIKKNYGDLEKNIEEQYRAFKKMVDGVSKDPEKGERYRGDFKKTYRKQKGRLNLNEYYRAITEDHGPFGRPLLKDYLEHCNGNRKIMEARCAHLAYLFHIGLIALMAYYVVTEDDEDEFREEWGQKVIVIQTKMQEALDKCTEEE
ncbi:protein rapunzel-like isoform 1-T4 [Clarias gariepinus]|uniref:protein rapunzel-like n=1 Tax=Clarias gariepinus TaxID=13013 RepID=UPI00234CDBDB|nr:protein rapunzel-like [Clarias gariepinus]XP_053343676.1 protein rapunzel-like [Clarias gariepinus]XP_053343677.1 protein rapunzel-like [Clarias gariepinus]XP_053343678.1 protein rapunzel-like [Clarias gariepinus]